MRLNIIYLLIIISRHVIIFRVALRRTEGVVNALLAAARVAGGGGGATLLPRQQLEQFESNWFNSTERA